MAAAAAGVSTALPAIAAAAIAAAAVAGSCGAPVHPPRHRVLTLGDGNFSFSLALKRKYPHIRLTATSFDSRDDLLRKYSECAPILHALDQLSAAAPTTPADTQPQNGAVSGGSVRVLHNVNACDIQSALPLPSAVPSSDAKAPAAAAAGSAEAADGRFDAVYFNHPHTGVENLHRHQALLAHFFAAVKPYLAVPSAGSAASATAHGQVLVSLCNDQPETWQMTAQALKSGLRLVRVFPFSELCYFGYSFRRHHSGKAFPVQNSRTFVYAVDAPPAIATPLSAALPAAAAPAAPALPAVAATPSDGAAAAADGSPVAGDKRKRRRDEKKQRKMQKRAAATDTASAATAAAPAVAHAAAATVAAPAHAASVPAPAALGTASASSAAVAAAANAGAAAAAAAAPKAVVSGAGRQPPLTDAERDAQAAKRALKLREKAGKKERRKQKLLERTDDALAHAMNVKPTPCPLCQAVVKGERGLATHCVDVHKLDAAAVARTCATARAGGGVAVAAAASPAPGDAAAAAAVEQKFVCTDCVGGSARTFADATALRQHMTYKHSTLMRAVVDSKLQAGAAVTAGLPAAALDAARPAAAATAFRVAAATDVKAPVATARSGGGSDDGGGFVCGVCQIRFDSAAALAEHRNDLKPTSGVKFACAVCARAFANAKAVVQHTLLAHPSLAPAATAATPSA